MSEDSTPYKTAEPVDCEGPQPGYPTQPYSNVYIEDKSPIYDPAIIDDSSPINAAGLANKLAGQPSNTVIAVRTGSAEMDLILLINAALESVPVDANAFERVATYIIQSLYHHEKSPSAFRESLAAAVNQSEFKALAAKQQASERDKQLRSNQLRSKMFRDIANGTTSSCESEDGAKAGVK